MTRALALSTLGLLLACGEPLQEAAYRGDPDAVFVAVLDQMVGSSLDALPSLQATIMWSIDGDRDLVQHPGLSVPATLGAEMRFVLYRPPPAVARTAGYAMGKFVLYDDTDGDGIKDPDEAFRVGPSPTTLFWSPSGLTAADAPVTHPIPAGYVVVAGWPPCAGPYATAPAAADCDVPLGQMCADPRGCGAGGSCLRTPGAFDAGGLCGVLATAQGECVPPASRRVPYNAVADAFYWVWARACESDADCAAVQVCGRASGTCVLRADELQIELRPEGAGPEVCRDDDTTYDGERP